MSQRKAKKKKPTGTNRLEMRPFSSAVLPEATTSDVGFDDLPEEVLINYTIYSKGFFDSIADKEEVDTVQTEQEDEETRFSPEWRTAPAARTYFAGVKLKNPFGNEDLRAKTAELISPTAIDLFMKSSTRKPPIHPSLDGVDLIELFDMFGVTILSRDEGEHVWPFSGGFLIRYSWLNGEIKNDFTVQVRFEEQDGSEAIYELGPDAKWHQTGRTVAP